MKLHELPNVIRKRTKMDFPFPAWIDGESNPDLWAGAIFGWYIDKHLTIDDVLKLYMQLEAHNPSSDYFQYFKRYFYARSKEKGIYDGRA